jgi:hypothetical protein
LDLDLDGDMERSCPGCTRRMDAWMHEDLDLDLDLGFRLRVTMPMGRGSSLQRVAYSAAGRPATSEAVGR